MEEWKDVNESYQVSNLGRVRSRDKIKTTSNNQIKKYSGKILAFGYINGYPVVNIKGKAVKVHQLVAKAFLPNPKDCKVINHIDGNKRNNKAANLEWCTQAYNCLHAFRTGLRKPQINKGYANGYSKEVENIITGDKYGSLAELLREVKLEIKYNTLKAKLNGQNTNDTNYRYVCST